MHSYANTHTHTHTCTNVDAHTRQTQAKHRAAVYASDEQTQRNAPAHCLGPFRGQSSACVANVSAA